MKDALHAAIGLTPFHRPAPVFQPPPEGFGSRDSKSILADQFSGAMRYRELAVLRLISSEVM